MKYKNKIILGFFRDFLLNFIIIDCPAVVLGAVETNISVSLGCYPGADQEPTTPGGNTVVHTCSTANVPIQTNPNPNP